MTKTRFFHMIASRAGVSPADAKAVIEAMSSLTKEALEAGQPMRIPEIGKIYPVEMPARLANNPRTGEKVFVEAGWSVRFRAAAALKAASAS